MLKKYFTFLLLFCAVMHGAENYPGKLKRQDGRIFLEIHGKQIYPSGLRWWLGKKADKDFYAEPGVVKDFSGQGIKIVFLSTSLGWKEDGTYDYTAIDRAVEKILKESSVYIIPAIDMRWGTAWWNKKNPGERYMRMVKGVVTPRGGSSTASFFSDRFRVKAETALRNYIRHMEEKGYASRVIGYQVNWGKAGEWISWEHLADMNPAALEKFRSFLRQKYKNDVKLLRSAWKDAAVCFDTAVPAAELHRTGNEHGYINDPADSSRIPDYVECYRTAITDMLLHFLRVVKSATSGRALAGAYVSPGYYYQQFERVVKSDSFDFGVSSSLYFNRRINGVSLSQAISLEAFRKNGKLYWHDADSRTYLWPDERSGVCLNVYESIMFNRREFGSMFTKGMGLTWYNLNWDRNVYNNAAIMKEIGKIQALSGAALETGCDFSSHAEIAVVYDPINVFRNPYRSNAPLFVNYLKMGAPVDFYTLNDLKHLVDAGTQYKLVILAGCGYLESEERGYIKVLQKDRRTLLFMYANGIAGKDGFDCSAVKELSGFDSVFETGSELKIHTVPEYRNLFPDVIPMLGQIAAPAGVRRLCVIPENGDEVIAVSARDGKAAFVIRRNSDWTAIQFPGYQTYPSVLRAIAELAGCRIFYPYTDSTIQSCRDFISLTGGAAEQEL